MPLGIRHAAVLVILHLNCAAGRPRWCRLVQVERSPCPESLFAGMVFTGADLGAMFAAADANDGDFTKEIYDSYKGSKQCRRRYSR